MGRLILALVTIAACTYPADPYRIDLTKLERSYVADDAAFVAWDRKRRLEIVRANPQEPALTPHEGKVKDGRAAFARCAFALRDVETALGATERQNAPLDEVRVKLDSAKTTCAATRASLADLGVPIPGGVP